MQDQNPQCPYKHNTHEQAHQAWKHLISSDIIHSAIDKKKNENLQAQDTPANHI